jgi:hypothetical protein
MGGNDLKFKPAEMAAKIEWLELRLPALWIKIFFKVACLKG